MPTNLPSRCFVAYTIRRTTLFGKTSKLYYYVRFEKIVIKY